MPKPTTPAPIDAGEIYELIINGTVAAGGSNKTPCGNNYFYKRTVIGTALTKANIVAGFIAAHVNALVAAAHQDYAVNSISIRNLADATDAGVIVPSALVGAIATDREPSEDAVVVRLYTGFRGKVFRGFKHFGGTNEVDTTQDVLTGAGLARWQTVAASCASAYFDADGNQWKPFLFSRYKSQILANPTVIRGTVITSSVLNKRVSLMKKRRAQSVV